jgi:hypothetical protein
MVVASGLSGNEILGLHEIGLAPGDLVVGNNVLALGIQGGIQSAFSTRQTALSRLLVEDIQTIIRPFFEIQEMMMGTAPFDEKLPAECLQNPVTSNKTRKNMTGESQGVI